MTSATAARAGGLAVRPAPDTRRPHPRPSGASRPWQPGQDRPVSSIPPRQPRPCLTVSTAAPMHQPRPSAKTAGKALPQLHVPTVPPRINAPTRSIQPPPAQHQRRGRARVPDMNGARQRTLSLHPAR